MVIHATEGIDIEASISTDVGEVMLRNLVKRFPWSDIASETIDNAIGHYASNVTVEWDTRSGTSVFRVCDDGHGSGHPEAFLRPGLTTGNPDPTMGNSTFGLGLCAIERHLQGNLMVATKRAASGSAWIIERDITKGQNGRARRSTGNGDVLASYGVPGNHGTAVTFSGFGKYIPNNPQVEAVADALSLAYTPALQSGKKITLYRNGKAYPLVSVEAPALEEENAAEFCVGGHNYVAQWGIATRPVARAGCGLVYGAKLFAHETTPFRGLSGRLFHCRLQIPHSAGSEAMETCKRFVADDFMEPVYESLWAIIANDLRRAHDLAETSEDAEFNSLLCDVLTGGNQASSTSRRKVAGGNEDLREFKGRDPNNSGVSPAGTGKKRNGRKRFDTSRVARDARIDWVAGGDHEPPVEWKHDGSRIVFNEDVHALARLRDQRNHEGLLLLAIPVVAHAEANRVDGSLFPEMQAHDITRELLRRLDSRMADVNGKT